MDSCDDILQHFFIPNPPPKEKSAEIKDMNIPRASTELVGQVG